MNYINSEIVIFADSDGQYDPNEINLLLTRLTKDNVIVGYRNPRVDPYHRKFYSKLFGFVFRYMFKIELKDPSSPFLAVYVENIQFLKTVVPKLSFGFWWEFQARIKSRGLEIVEVPVSHRHRR